MWNDEDSVCAKFKEFEACRVQLSSVSAVCCCYFSRRFINKNCEEKKKVHSYIFIQSPHLSHLVFLLSLPFLLSCARVFFPAHTIYYTVCMDSGQEEKGPAAEEKNHFPLSQAVTRNFQTFFDSFLISFFYDDESISHCYWVCFYSIVWWSYSSRGWISKNTIISELNTDGMG